MGFALSWVIARVIGDHDAATFIRLYDKIKYLKVPEKLLVLHR